MKLNLNKVLIYVLAGIVSINLIITAAGFISGKASCHNVRHGDPSGVAEIKNAGQDLAEFKDLGTIRALTMAEENEATGVSLAVAPWFAYEKSDSAFNEELVLKKGAFKTIFLQYFSTHTQKELFSLGEKKVKEDLLELINSNLEMGKIKAIYFDKYIFFD